MAVRISDWEGKEMEKVNVQCAPADVFQKITRDIAFVKVSLLAEEE